ncbi:unnamed protein product [Victoria cruziana]
MLVHNRWLKIGDASIRSDSLQHTKLLDRIIGSETGRQRCQIQISRE